MNKPNIRLAKQRKKTNALPSLDSLFAEIQRRQLIVFIDERGKATIWSPNTKLPMWIYRTMVRFNAELVEGLGRGDKRLCPSTDLHKRSQQRRANGVCRMCRYLDAWFLTRQRNEGAA